MSNCTILFMLILMHINPDIKQDILDDKRVIIQSETTPIGYCRFP